MKQYFSRTEQLLGKQAMDRLYQAKVAVFGIGGVGSFAVEALARSGVGHLVLVDKDTVSQTNINRQLIATTADSRTIARVIIPTPGAPAVPIEASTAVSITESII